MPNEMNEISVVIPMYNGEKYILETLESIRMQTLAPKEILIIDDVSSDKSVVIVSEYCDKYPQFRLICLDKNNGGPAAPRNIGISESIGDYIAFVDADDIWTIDKLEKQMALMKKAKLNFISSSAYLINEQSKLISSQKEKQAKKSPTTYSVKELIFRNRIITSSVIVHNSLLQGFRFREEKHMQAVEDYVLWLNLLDQQNCRYLHLREALVGYRVLENSISHQYGRLKYAAKSMAAAGQFLYESDNIKLFGYLLWSNALRSIKLILINRYY